MDIRTKNNLGQNFSGSAARNSMSDKTVEHIDSAIKSIVDEIYDKSHDILIKNKDLIDHCARELLQQETLTEQQLLDMTRNMYRVEAT